MEEALPPMTSMFPMPAYFLGILLLFYAFIGWWSAREANRAMPAPDTRTRPAAEAIAAAAITLGIEYPSTKDEIRRARHSLMPRALGETFARSEEHTSELRSLMRISYAVFCLKKKNTNNQK